MTEKKLVISDCLVQGEETFKGENNRWKVELTIFKFIGIHGTLLES